MKYKQIYENCINYHIKILIVVLTKYMNTYILYKVFIFTLFIDRNYCNTRDC